MNAFCLACLTQILEGYYVRMNWISDGSASKVIEDATVTGLELSSRGLVLLLSSGGKVRRCSWRMSQDDATTILAAWNGSEALSTTSLYACYPFCNPFKPVKAGYNYFLRQLWFYVPSVGVTVTNGEFVSAV